MLNSASREGASPPRFWSHSPSDRAERDDANAHRQHDDSGRSGSPDASDVDTSRLAAGQQRSRATAIMATVFGGDDRSGEAELSLVLPTPARSGGEFREDRCSQGGEPTRALSSNTAAILNTGAAASRATLLAAPASAAPSTTATSGGVYGGGGVSGGGGGAAAILKQPVSPPAEGKENLRSADAPLKLWHGTHGAAVAVAGPQPPRRSSPASSSSLGWREPSPIAGGALVPAEPDDVSAVSSADVAAASSLHSEIAQLQARIAQSAAAQSPVASPNRFALGSPLR